LQNEGYDIARWLNSFGVAGFILRYRLPTDYPFPTPQLDLRRAMRLVRSNAPQWGLKSDRIGVIGFSAGGHLASTLATLFDAPELAAADVPRDATSCRPDFAILAYPVIAFSQDYCHAGTRENLIGRNAPAELVRRMSTELQVTAQTPPTFLFHSTDDQSVDVRNAVDFYLACKAKGVSAAMHLFPHGGHGYGVGGPGTDESQWPAICQRWMGNLGLLKK
jgi:acetyl esterase/lipase